MRSESELRSESGKPSPPSQEGSCLSPAELDRAAVEAVRHLTATQDRQPDLGPANKVDELLSRLA
jgi:hypothetical protein